MSQYQPIQPGDVVGPYLVLESLGSGAAATVFRAKDQETDAICALKVLRPEVIADENVQRRFLREVSVMEKLNHENLVQIRGSGVHGDTAYYAMELVDSGTIKDVLNGPIPWRDVAESGVQLAAALAAMHEQGVVHRDLKPANIYLSSTGHIKIGDFGLARDLNANRLTLDGMTVGTVLYMAPEQVRGESEISGGVDLYALGCVLYQMLTGVHPFAANSATEVFDHHLNSPPPSARQVVPYCPERFSRLVQRLMAKQPSERPASANEVADELREILANETSTENAQASAVAESTSAAASEAPNLTQRLHRTQQASHPQVSWRVLAAIGAVVVIAIVLASVLGR